MISFSENPESYYAWVISHEDPSDVLKLLAQPFHDGTWTTAPLLWVHLMPWALNWKATRKGATELRTEFIHKLLSASSIDDSAHAVLPAVFESHYVVPLDEAAAVSCWLAERAEPNDAALIAEILNAALRPDDTSIVAECRPLVEWLFIKGSSELRSGRRSTLVAQLLTVVLLQGWSELLAVSVRFLLYNHSRLDHCVWKEQLVDLLAQAVEQLLSRGASSAIIGDVGGALSPGELSLFVHRVLDRWEDFPLSRGEVIKRLGSGEFELRNPTDVWSWVIAGPPCDLRLRDEAIARVAALGLLKVLQEITHAKWSRGLFGKELHPDRESWARSVASELLRTTELLLTRNKEDIRLLQQFRSHEDGTVRGLFDAVRCAVRELKDNDLDQVRLVLEGQGTGPGVVHAALQLLYEDKKSGEPATGQTPDVDHVLEALQLVLGTKELAFSGIDLRRILGAAEHVVTKNLGDRAFDVEAGTLSVSEASLHDVCKTFIDKEEQRAVGVLFVLHELVHVQQGIAGNDNVKRVRFAGAEGALMHMDLGADHVAANIAASVFPEWDLLWIKDLQGKSISAFPAGPRHPLFSRIRKTLRLVGLRADLLIRKSKIAEEQMTPETYAFADFGPGGGDIVFLVNRPPFAIVHAAPLSGADANVLFEGVDGQPGARERVDEVLNKVIETAGSRI